jgi:hypothetical protein
VREGRSIILGELVLRWPRKPGEEYRMKDCAPLILSLVILSGGIALYCKTAIRMQVNEKLPQSSRFYWWRLNYSTNRQIYQKHREFYPNSVLPLISRSALGLAVAGWVICRVLLKVI